jgi:hypothetical protein
MHKKVWVALGHALQAQQVRFSAPKMRSTSVIKPCFLLYTEDVDENVFSKTFLFSCQQSCSSEKSNFYVVNFREITSAT